MGSDEVASHFTRRCARIDAKVREQSVAVDRELGELDREAANLKAAPSDSKVGIKLSTRRLTGS